jgi:hypothetical protein
VIPNAYATNCNVDFFYAHGGSCEYTGAPPDTIRIVDPTTNDDLTAERLQEITAAGPATFEFTPSYAQITDECGIAPRNGGNIYQPWSQPMFMTGCASSLKIDVTISRNWATGLAGSAKSADMAVVRAPGVIDQVSSRFVRTSASSTAEATQIVHHAGAGTSFSADLEATASANQAANVDFNTAPVVVSRTPNNVDAFWVDDKGGLYTVFESGPSWTWQTKEIFQPGFCEPLALGRACEWLSGILPTDAAVSAVVQSPENLVVFAIGNDGNLWNSWWATSSGVDSQGLPNWATPATITSTSPCYNTNGSCAGVGAPGGPIASIAQSPTALDVFFIGNDGGVWSSYWTASFGWATEEIYGPSSRIQYGSAVAKPGAGIAATARDSEHIDVFFVGLDGGLWTSSWAAGGGGWGTSEVGVTKGAGMSGWPVTAVARQPNTLDVVFQGAVGRLNWAYWTPATSWNMTTIPTTGGGTLAGGTFWPGGLSLVAPTSFSLQLFYLDSIREPNTLTWSDPCNTTLGCSSKPGDFPWSKATPLYPPY